MPDQETHLARCHCGGVVLELRMPRGIDNLRRCNCSMCRRRGAIVCSVAKENLRVVRGEELLTLYQFNTRVAEHYFCSVCGVYTHHGRRSNPLEYGVNAGCIDGVDPYQLGEVPVLDGVNHPSDR